MPASIGARLRLPARAAAIAAVTAGLVAGTAAAPVEEEPRGPLEYVALGDSFSAGVGAPAGAETDECGLSPLGFPGLLDQRQTIELTVNAACGGATTEDILDSQLQELSDDTELVTITIGGNDIGFAAIAGSCSANPGSMDCAEAVRSAISRTAHELPQELTTTFNAIRRAAPYAHVVALGYPYLVSPKFGHFGAGTEAAGRLNAGVDLLNAAIGKAAAAAGFQYVDVTEEFRHHGVGSPHPWIHGHGPALFHPTVEGYKKGYLKAFKTKVQLHKLQQAAVGR